MEIGVYEAKTHFARLVARVEKGERITITRHGKPVAVLTPAQGIAREDTEALIERMRAFREQLAAQGVRITAREIKAWISEGRP
jgi:prevent-host-death family protein